MVKQKQILGIVDNRVMRLHSKKLVKRGEGQCWSWNGAHREDGYGVMRIKGRTYLAHRVAVVLSTRQEIPEGLVVDHLCRNKACCNPAHLEAITQTINVARHHAHANPESRCKHGHTHKRGRPCPTCNREKQAAWRAANPEKSRAISRRYDSKRSQSRAASNDARLRTA